MYTVYLKKIIRKSVAVNVLHRSGVRLSVPSFSNLNRASGAYSTRLIRGSMWLCQRHFGLTMDRQTCYIQCGTAKMNYHSPKPFVASHHGSLCQSSFRNPLLYTVPANGSICWLSIILSYKPTKVTTLWRYTNMFIIIIIIIIIIITAQYTQSLSTFLVV